MCKIGFPITSLEKYTELISEKEYGFIVYYYNKEKKELEIIQKYEGKKKNTIIQERENCYICSSTTKYYQKRDEYIEAVAKLYEEEIEGCRTDE